MVMFNLWIIQPPTYYLRIKIKKYCGKLIDILPWNKNTVILFVYHFKVQDCQNQWDSNYSLIWPQFLSQKQQLFYPLPKLISQENSQNITIWSHSTLSGMTSFGTKFSTNLIWGFSDRKMKRTSLRQIKKPKVIEKRGWVSGHQLGQ